MFYGIDKIEINVWSIVSLNQFAAGFRVQLYLMMYSSWRHSKNAECGQHVFWRKRGALLDFWTVPTVFSLADTHYDYVKDTKLPYSLQKKRKVRHQQGISF